MRKIVVFLAVAAILAVCWYLFIKPHEYKVTFSVKTFPGTINQTIKIWNRSLDNAKIIKQVSVNTLVQQFIEGNHTYLYKWKMNLINDSTSQVIVYITEPGHSMVNKLSIPFLDTQLEQDAEKNVRNFYNIIIKHLDNITVKVEGISEIERTYCAYIPLHTTQVGKANGMMANYSLLSSFIADNSIQPDGLPFVEVTNWNKANDSLQYNFCFPIAKTDSLPINNIVKYKWLEHTKAIKAVYNGNYITSDRAWYALIYYAKKNGFEAINKPVEIYHNNPNFGGDEKKWQADIYLPIK